MNERTVRELLARIAVRPLPKAARAQVAARPTRAEILAWAVDPHGRPTRGPHSYVGLDVNFRRVKGMFPEIISSLELAYFPGISLEMYVVFGEALLFGNRDLLVFPLILYRRL